MVSRTYSSVELARRAGISYRRLDYWTRAGLFHPSDMDTPYVGSGQQRRYTDGDLAAVRVLAVLMDLRTRDGDDAMTARFREIAATVQRYGLRGRTKILPGVWLDLDEIAETYDREDVA